jgi:hypothetical protein
VKYFPNEVKVTKVSREGHGKKRIQDISSKPTTPGGRKKLRLLANIVPPCKQEDTGDNSRIFWCKEKAAANCKHCASTYTRRCSR